MRIIPRPVKTAIGSAEPKGRLPFRTSLFRRTTGRTAGGPPFRRRNRFQFDDPLVLQISHFAEVIAGTAEPVVSGADGLAAVEVITAIKRSAATGETVEIANL